MLADLHLLLIAQLVEDLAQFSVDDRFTRRIIGSVSQMISSSQRRDQILHVKLEVSEKVDVLPSFKRAEGIDSSVYG